MKSKSRIYLLDSQTYSPETIAVAFAKTSRSPESFDLIAAELTEQKSAEFNEKWVVGYGHSSVAEHAVLHIAIENVSRLAVENLESNRLASYTEKSTRYQTWESGAYHTPVELEGSKYLNAYTNVCNQLFDLYARLIPRISEVVALNCAPKEGESESSWKRRVQSTAVDSCRFVLPAASIANVGMTINARVLEHAISKMLSSGLAEVRSMGAEIKAVAQNSVPTLVKYANANPYPGNIETQVQDLPRGETIEALDWCQLVDHTPEVQTLMLAAILYRYRNFAYTQAIETIQLMIDSQRAELVKEVFVGHNRYTPPIREIEHGSFTFDILLDQGAWYEVKRHRMLTLTTQAFTPAYGYTVPALIDQCGMRDEYEALMKACAELYPLLEETANGIGSYLLPNAFKRRFLITTNLRSAIHFINLRSAPNAHYSVRRLAARMAEQIKHILPEFAPYLFCDDTGDWREIENKYFAVP